MNEIKAYLQGGLGNQCFIYAAARAAALRTGAELVLDGSYFLDDKIYRRKFALDAFSLRTPRLCVSALKAIRLFRRLRYVLLRDRVSRFGNYVCDRRPFKFRPLPGSWNGTLTLDGYFQSEKYFYDQREQVLKDFTLKDDSWLGSDRLAQEIAKTEHSIFLHVRSYMEVPGKENGECALQLIDYYRDAIAYVNTHVPSGRLFVFSDDIEWAKHHVLSCAQQTSRLPITFNDAASSQLRDFTLMRMCRHGIVADSSFSWWAGWLGEQERLKRGDSAIRIHVNRLVLNADFWTDRWIAI